MDVPPLPAAAPRRPSQQRRRCAQIPQSGHLSAVFSGIRAAAVAVSPAITVGGVASRARCPAVSCADAGRCERFVRGQAAHAGSRVAGFACALLPRVFTERRANLDCRAAGIGFWLGWPFSAPCAGLFWAGEAVMTYSRAYEGGRLRFGRGQDHAESARPVGGGWA
jgi:hypothetical protein